MTITVEAGDRELCALLFIRWAFGCDPSADVPLSLVGEPSLRDEAFRHTSADVADAWPAAWASRVSHLADFDDFDLDGRGWSAYVDAWQSRHANTPVLWEDRLDAWVSRSDFEGWLHRAAAGIDEGVRTTLVADFIRAWHAGLTHVSIVPLDMPFYRALPPHRLLVSAATWGSDPALAEALRRWRTERGDADGGTLPA